MSPVSPPSEILAYPSIETPQIRGFSDPLHAVELFRRHSGCHQYQPDEILAQETPAAVWGCQLGKPRPEEADGSALPVGTQHPHGRIGEFQNGAAIIKLFARLPFDTACSLFHLYASPISDSPCPRSPR